MQKYIAALLLTVLLLIASGCATSLNSSQKQDLRSYQAKGLEVREKSPGTGAALGFLPGGGSFYAREYGFGVVNLLLWPYSILWDPVSGYKGSQSINYFATKSTVDKKMRSEITALDDNLALNVISPAIYVKEKHRIEERYLP
jgi:hypothetical protein